MKDASTLHPKQTFPFWPNVEIPARKERMIFPLQQQVLVRFDVGHTCSGRIQRRAEKLCSARLQQEKMILKVAFSLFPNDIA